LVEANEEKIVSIILEKLINFSNELDSKIESIEGFTFDKYIDIKGIYSLKYIYIYII